MMKRNSAGVIAWRRAAVKALFGLAAAFILLCQSGAQPLAMAEAPPLHKFLPNLSTLILAPVKLANNQALEISLKLDLEAGLHLTEKAPSRAFLSLEDLAPTSRHFASPPPVNVISASTDLSFKLPEGLERGSLVLEAALYYCADTGPSVCYMKSYRFVQPFEISSGPQAQAKLAFSAPLNRPKS